MYSSNKNRKFLSTNPVELNISGIFFGDFVFSTRIVFRSDTGVVRVVPMVVVVTVVVLVVVLGISEQSKFGQGQPFGQSLHRDKQKMHS